MSEIKARKNTDYSASAINLTNPPEVAERLRVWLEYQDKIDALNELLKAYPETQQIAELQKEQSGYFKEIQDYIEGYGSYQDVENGHYALKQKAVTVSYLPEKVHECLAPALAAAVIVESVDKSTVEALVKAGRITPEQQEAISKKSETYRFIIR